MLSSNTGIVIAQIQFWSSASRIVMLTSLSGIVIKEILNPCLEQFPAAEADLQRILAPPTDSHLKDRSAVR
jgi:hypothetical protein